MTLHFNWKASAFLFAFGFGHLHLAQAQHSLQKTATSNPTSQDKGGKKGVMATVTTFNTLDLAGLNRTLQSPAAYSLRKLSSSYTGNAIRVFRSSDNTYQDIGFTAQGDLDTVALKTFVGSGNGTVEIWYDQSGNGRDARSNSSDSRPVIVESGVVSRKSNVPTLTFTSSGLSTSNFSGYTSGFTLALCAGVSYDKG